MASSGLGTARARALVLHACPIDWSLTGLTPGLIFELHEIWVERLETCSGLWTTELPVVIEDPVDFLLRQIREEDDEDFLNDTCNTVSSLIPEVRQKYIDDAKGLKNLRVADRNQYRKHFPNPKASATEIRKATLDGISRFYNGVTADRLTQVLFEALEGHLRSLLGSHRLKFVVSGVCTVGASFGEESEFILFDIDLATPLAHAYPIPPGQVQLHDQFPSSDILQGFVVR